MLFVRFTDVPDPRIANYERLTFAEAVATTHALHDALTGEGKSSSGDFRLFDQKDELLYRGTFTFGTEGSYLNLYQQVRDRVQRIRTKKEEAAKKIWLLEEIESETPDEYKRQTARTVTAAPTTYQSRLTRLQRRLIYGTTIVGLLFTTGFSATQVLIDREAYAEQTHVADKKWLEAYEQALQNDEEPLIALLEQKNRTEEERDLLIDLYLSSGEDEKAQGLVNDPILVETKLASLALPDTEKLERLQDFQKRHPTDEGAFDIAVLEQNYEIVTKTEDVEWATDRIAAKVNAYLYFGEIASAKEWANKTSDPYVQSQLSCYQETSTELKKLQNKLRKTSSKDQSARERIQSAITAKEVDLQIILYSKYGR